MSLLELDVPQLEASLKEFMRSSPEFADYDYDGSNVSALIRLMAYNTWKNAWYVSMTHSEGFLDSAQLRSSVVSHAKELNYTPRSVRSARARVQISFSGTEPSYVLEKGQTLSSVVRSRGLIFSLPETSLLTSSNGHFSLTTDVYEGRYVRDDHVIDGSETQRLLLSNPSADVDSLTVVVYEDGATQGVQHTRATTLLDVDETSRVFFLQATEDGRYEILFGDGVVGRRPPLGSRAVLDYRTSVGAEGNGARSFSVDFSPGTGISNLRVTTLSTSVDGAAAESVDSVRYYAPRHFQVQERAVVGSDYEVLLKTNFPEIRAVSAFGGEDANPPMYGKVIIAVDVDGVEGIPDSKRRSYTEFLRRRAGLTVQPVIVEPSRIYASVRSQVLYDVNRTKITPESLSAIVSDRVSQYADENLNDFESRLRYSRLVSLIDSSHPSVVSNRTSVEVYSRVPVDVTRRLGVVVDLSIPLLDTYPETGTSFPIGDTRTVRSSLFYAGSELRFLTDDGDGGLWVATERGNFVTMIEKVGEVDYQRGTVSIEDLRVDRLVGESLRVYGKPADLDVEVSRSIMLMLEPADVHVTVTPVRE